MIKEYFEGALDALTIGSVIGYVMAWFTIPNFVAIFTLIWAMARAFESVFGMSIYEWWNRKK